MSSQVTLNRDILTELAWYIELDRESDLLSLMCTCKSMYAAGIPALLSRDIYFSQGRILAIFCEFILVDLISRAQHIVALTFMRRTGPLQESLADKLIQVLQHATRLRKLSLRQCDQWLVTQPKLTQAISRLKTVKILDIDAHGALGSVVNKMESPIEAVTLCLIGQPNPEDNDVVRFLAPFQSTVKEVYLRWPGFPRLHPDLVYRHVHLLELIFWDDIHDMRSIVHAFPLVKSLRMTVDGYDGDTCEDIASLGHWNTIRARNRRAQERAQWRYIKEVCSTAIALYLTALQVDVGTLRLYTSTMNIDVIRTILSDVHPKDHFELSLSIKWERQVFPSSGSAEKLLGVLVAAACDLTRLQVTIEGAPPGNEVISPVFDAMFSMCKLTHITLKVSSRPQLSRRAIVERLVRQARKLQTVVLTFGELGTSFWRVHRHDGGLDAGGSSSNLTVTELGRRDGMKLEMHDKPLS